VSAAVDRISGDFGVDTGNNTELILFSPWLRAEHVPVRVARQSMRSRSSIGGSMELQSAQVNRFTLGSTTLSGVSAPSEL